MTSLPQKPDWLERVAIVGVGLLGGSVGMSLRRSGVFVSGFSRKQTTCDAAIQAGAVDVASTDLEQACEEADIVVIASPVDKIAELARSAFSFAPSRALVTDVGSTKSRLVAEVESLIPQFANRFVGAHPIAGSEKTGVTNASQTLLDGKPVIVTPTESTAAVDLERVSAFWRLAGSDVLTMTASEHDDRLASISHVPHLVSSLLASLIDDRTAPLVGSGWKDMTRVASGDPRMWAAICDHNREAIVSQLDQLAAEVSRLRERLSDTDPSSLLAWLEAAKTKKDSV